MPPSVADVPVMLGLLASQHCQSVSTGQCWYDHKRVKCEDPELIRAWFQRVLRIKAKYGILDDDSYNFDEAGFQMGVSSTAKVVTGADRVEGPRTTQPGNREWVTVIEAINARGFAIPPLVIFEAAVRKASWYKDGLLPPDWAIGVSKNGWTINEIGLWWLEHVFDKYTKDRTVGRYRLLILDDHGSDVSPKFDQFCIEHSIVVICMPAHSSHLLQPLDIDCFPVLKRSYGRLLKQRTSLGIHHIVKQEFLALYQQARIEALQEKNIRSGFAATGLIPYDPNRILSLLNTQHQTPSSPKQPQQQQLCVAEAFHDITELQHQTDLLKQYLKRRAQNPPSPKHIALNQFLKGCQMIIDGVVLLAREHERLRAENQRLKRKRVQRRSYIQKGGILTVAEGRALIEKKRVTRAEGVGNELTRTRQRAPPRCSVCQSLEHNARTCQERRRAV